MNLSLGTTMRLPILNTGKPKEAPSTHSTRCRALSFRWSGTRDFLYVELNKAILRGSAPRQCRLCRRWFLYEQGDRAIYCEHVAPGGAEQTCREIGARAVFEKKIRRLGIFQTRPNLNVPAAPYGA